MSQYVLTADSCPDGPCPRMARNPQRQTTALQGYVPTENLDAVMRDLPPRETRIEMSDQTLLTMLAEHLTDDEVDWLVAHRCTTRAAV